MNDAEHPAETAPVALAHIQVAELRPDDILVVTTPEYLPEAYLDRVRDSIRSVGITNKVLVFERSELAILRPTGAQP